MENTRELLYMILEPAGPNIRRLLSNKQLNRWRWSFSKTSWVRDTRKLSSIRKYSSFVNLAKTNPEKKRFGIQERSSEVRFES